MVLVTGPTEVENYYTLQYFKTINKPSMNILLQKIQWNMNLKVLVKHARDDIGYSFETALRSFLQDPEVILVGEIRDKATVIALKVH